jgi:hypothetical protein
VVGKNGIMPPRILDVPLLFLNERRVKAPSNRNKVPNFSFHVDYPDESVS